MAVITIECEIYCAVLSDLSNFERWMIDSRGPYSWSFSNRKSRPCWCRWKYCINCNDSLYNQQGLPSRRVTESRIWLVVTEKLWIRFCPESTRQLIPDNIWDGHISAGTWIIKSWLAWTIGLFQNHWLQYAWLQTAQLVSMDDKTTAGDCHPVRIFDAHNIPGQWTCLNMENASRSLWFWLSPRPSYGCGSVMVLGAMFHRVSVRLLSCTGMLKRGSSS